MILGSFEQSIDFNGEQVTTTNPHDAFVVMFGGADAYKWHTAFGTQSFLGGTQDVGLDPQLNVVVSGIFSGEADFGGGPLTTASGNFATYVAKLSPTGTELWARKLEAGAQVFFNPSTVLPSGETVVAGAVQVPIDFGTGTLTPKGTDAFVAKLGF